MAEREEQIIEGTGNVFNDLGLTEADELLANAELTHLVYAELRDRNLTPAAAARLLDVQEAEIVQLMAGRFVRLPTGRLLHLLTVLGRDVEIIVRPRSADRSRAPSRRERCRMISRKHH